MQSSKHKTECRHTVRLQDSEVCHLTPEKHIAPPYFFVKLQCTPEDFFQVLHRVALYITAILSQFMIIANTSTTAREKTE